MRQGSITLSLSVAVLLAVMPAAPASAQGRELPEQSGAPRFLLASASTVKALDVERTPVLGRRLELRLHSATVKEALAQIIAQSDLRLGYSDDLLPRSRRVNLSADGITVVAALTDVLFGTGLDVLFTGDDKVTLVRRSVGLSEQGGTIVGRVTDAKTGARLAGVDVFLEGTPRRTATDSSGRYRLRDIAPGTYTLVARRLGYTKQSRKVTVRAEREDTVDLALEPAAAKLDELVTTATGQQRRGAVGNHITTIQADSVMQHAVIRNLTDLLATRVPGLTVQHTSGAPGDPAKLRFRGLGSALRSNDPVVVVDGIRVYAAQSEARSGNLANSALPAPSPLDQIDMNTVEKVEVLKGASAATLYGADAANGVIVITTKRGKPGPTQWNASLEYGRTDQPGRWPTGYYRWGHDQFDGAARFCTLLDVSCVPDSLVQFQALNVPALSIVDQGRKANLSLTASGGTQALTYSITGTYGDQTGLYRLPDFEVARFREMHQREAPDWMRRSHDYRDWGVSSNVTARLNPAADVTLRTSLHRSEQRRTSLEGQLGPLQGTYIDTLNQLYYTPNGSTGCNNPGCGYILNSTTDVLKDYYRRSTASTITVTTGLNANWHPRPWFTASGDAGLNVMPRDDQSLVEGGLLALTDSGTLSRGTGRSVMSTLNLQGTLLKSLGHGFLFRTAVGANLTSTTSSDLMGAADKLAPGTKGFLGATGFHTSDRQESISVFGWSIEPTITSQRFSLSTGLRLDGGSAYGTRVSRVGGGGGGFLKGLLALPRLNGSWVISEYPWFPFQSLFSSLRLRGAYGQAQVQPGAADRLRLYDQRVRLTTLGNTQLRPERSSEIEGGFDAELLDNRLRLEVNGYHRLQLDALMPVDLPVSVNGGGTVLKNIGNIRNRGFDLIVGVTPVRSPTLAWSAQLTYNRNTNTLLKLGRGVDPNPEVGLVAGYPLYSRWAYPIVGFDDANHDNVLQVTEIRLGDAPVYMGRLQPVSKLGLTTDVELFGGAVGITAGASYDGGMTQINALAHDNWVLNRALVDPSVPLSEQAAVLAADQVIVIPVPGGSGTRSVTTQYGLMQEVATWRFNSLSVNYRAPVRVARLLGAQRASIALQGANLGLHSSYRGKDPDVNAWSPGEGIRDTGQLPQPRTWQLALFLSY